jgi:hypothetical protein
MLPKIFLILLIIFLTVLALVTIVLIAWPFIAYLAA